MSTHNFLFLYYDTIGLLPELSDLYTGRHKKCRSVLLTLLIYVLKIILNVEML